MYSPPPGHGDCLQAELRQLYYFDTALEEDFNGAILTHIVDDTPGETCLLITVAEKCSWFTPLQFSRAKLTWHISAMTGRPSGRDFKNMVCSRSIKNCLLTFEDTTVAKSFFGQDLGLIIVEKIQTTPLQVVQDCSAISELIRQIQRHIRIAVDIMYVNSLTFMLTLSKSLK